MRSGRRATNTGPPGGEESSRSHTMGLGVCAVEPNPSAGLGSGELFVVHAAVRRIPLLIRTHAAPTLSRSARIEFQESKHLVVKIFLISSIQQDMIELGDPIDVLLMHTRLLYDARICLG